MRRFVLPRLGFRPFLIQGESWWRSSVRVRVALLVSVLFLAASVALPAVRLLPATQDRAFIPLHANAYFGIDRFGPREAVFLFPLGGLLLFLLNTFLAIRFFSSEPILSHFLLFSTALFELGLLIAVGVIILLTV